MITIAWVILGLVLLSVVVWAFRDVQVRMGNPAKSEVREDPPIELRRR